MINLDSKYESKFLKLNVSGKKCIVSKACLLRFPGSRLGQMANLTHQNILKNRLCDGFILPDEEYFFNRSADLIDIILGVYQYGRLHIRHNFCVEMVEEELEYWQLDIQQIYCKCCSFNAGFVALLPLQEEQLAGTIDPPTADLSNPTFREKLWKFVDEPKSSRGAMAFATISFLFVLTNVIMMTVDSLPSVRYGECCSIVYGLELVPKNRSIVSEEVETRIRCRTEKYLLNQAMCWLDFVCVMVFTFEYLIRLLASPNRLIFAKAPQNIVDLASVLPFYIETIVRLLLKHRVQGSTAVEYRKMLQVPRTLRLLRILRISRLLKFVRYSEDLQLIITCLHSVTSYFFLLSILLLLTSFFFAAALFYVEGDEAETSFTSIPSAAWWSIATYFAYGDAPPVTTLGKLIATSGAVLGVIITAIPMGLIIENFMTAFSEKYNRKKSRARATQEIRKMGKDSKQPENGGTEAKDHPGTGDNSLGTSSDKLPNSTSGEQNGIARGPPPVSAITANGEPMPADTRRRLSAIIDQQIVQKK